ncbi:MAG: helix-turn-helix domain-containing protein [Clostridium sp.]|nr:helix-turn-helix domain-containing protein [Clostridium sp.]
MNENEMKFGRFVEQKRKEQGITLRGLAGELYLAPSYMSDMEKGRRYPPDKGKLEEIARILKLAKEDKDLMYDLAAMAKENTVSPDLPEYIMEKDIVRVALRKARDKNVSDEDWKRVIEIFDDEDGEDN